jgi:tripartite-type tricarboxylate transporter receptor subunit TctC
MALWAGPLHAQTYPNRTVTIVVPIAAGGAVDTTARIFAEQLQAKFGQPFVVENKTGAGATIGTSYVAKAAPDGYTLLLMESSAPLAKWLFKAPPFDLLKDFTPLARVVSNPLVLFAHPSLPASDMKELIAHAKANPGKLQAGISGTSHQLTSNMLNVAAGIDIVAVPYRGTAPAVNDILSGTIALLWSTPVGLLQFVEQGKLKALAVSTPARVALMPNVPTLAESVAPSLQMEAWLGIAGPAALPDEVSVRLGEAVREVAALPALQKRIADTGQNLEYLPAEPFRERLRADQERLGIAIREAGIQPN